MRAALVAPAVAYAVMLLADPTICAIESSGGCNKPRGKGYHSVRCGRGCDFVRSARAFADRVTLGKPIKCHPGPFEVP